MMKDALFSAGLMSPVLTIEFTIKIVSVTLLEEFCFNALLLENLEAGDTRRAGAVQHKWLCKILRRD